MRAWTVDADDIRVAEDFDEALLHRTHEIDTFLSLDPDDKFIVIGTKGFGKTLLLKAKRILYQAQGRAACLPAGNLLDKPIGDKIFAKKALQFFSQSSLPWSKLWLTSISITILKHVGQTEDLKVHPALAAVIRDDRLRSVIDHFVRLLDLTPSELQRASTDADGYLVPRLRSITTPLAIFIDGIDEYFAKHIEYRDSHQSSTGLLSPDIWYFAQIGLVEVAYQLRRINHHIRVFAAVRKEAYARLQKTVMSQQYRGSAIDIVYSVESLREIFINNIHLERSDRMILPERLKEDPLQAFLGRTHVTHSYTGEREEVFEYICRHTLLRPRDLMTIGERLASLRPVERKDEHRLKEAVNNAATEIANEYLTEIAPYIGDLDLKMFFRTLPGHIISRAEVEQLFRAHHTSGFNERHFFCALYRVGLLGYLHHDWVRGEWIQRFLRPGECTLEADGVLPRATQYMVHPVLSDIIGRLSSAYFERIDRTNIIGYERRWRGAPGEEEPVSTETLCILAGDISGFAKLMEKDLGGAVRKALQASVRKWGRDAKAAECQAGDSVYILHDDPIELAQIARHLIDDVFRAPGKPRLRVALHHGGVQVRKGGKEGSLLIEGGDAVLCAARVEPHVEPGQIWATEEFQKQLAQEDSLWRTTPVTSLEGGDRINVKKRDREESDRWVRLFRVEF